ncbi:MAG: glycoside hydrolase family 5 protein [Spirochaetaceae bacterium]|jgi:endoglucanase|nr:glycoside hydrolase family 5 protein [Spirochaetaceae bacterium]
MKKNIHLAFCVFVMLSCAHKPIPLEEPASIPSSESVAVEPANLEEKAIAPEAEPATGWDSTLVEETAGETGTGPQELSDEAFVIYDPSHAIQKPADFITPVERYGRLQIADFDHDANPATAARRQLCDEWGNPIQLQGVSSFGLQGAEGDWILSEAAFDVLAYDWRSDLVRFVVYVTENGYASKPNELLAKIEKGIELANKRGLYTIVDWHIASPGNPFSPQYLDAGKNLPHYAQIRQAHPEYNGPQLFFAYLSQKYGHLPTILWEIAGEPNGNSTEETAFEVWKDKFLPYSQSLVYTIRDYDADQLDNIVICTTDNWSRFIDVPVLSPVQDKNGQIMYSVHFRAGTDDSGYDDEEQVGLRKKIVNALDGRLAVLCTEWGTDERLLYPPLDEGQGSRGPFIDFSIRWLNFLDEHKITWVSWSLARKAAAFSLVRETSSAVPLDTDNDGIPNWDWDTELSISGRFVRAMLRGEAVPLYKDSKLMRDFENADLGNFTLNADNPNSALNVKPAAYKGNGLAAISGISTNGIWDNRLQLSSQNFLYGIYRSLSFDLYLPVLAAADDDALFVVKPILQYAQNGNMDTMNWWPDMIPQTIVTGKDFALVSEMDLMKTTITISLKPLNPAPKDTLEHLILFVSLTDLSAGSTVYMDNVGFSSLHNGDILYQLPINDQ